MACEGYRVAILLCNIFKRYGWNSYFLTSYLVKERIFQDEKEVDAKPGNRESLSHSIDCYRSLSPRKCRLRSGRKGSEFDHINPQNLLKPWAMVILSVLLTHLCVLWGFLHKCLFLGCFFMSFLGRKFFLKITSLYQVILKQFDCSQPYIWQ